MEKVSAGSYDLNKWLYGGYEKDIITTIYGPAGSGKTNFCMLACVSQAKKANKVIFIDTEGGFSIDRFKQIAGEDYENVLKGSLEMVKGGSSLSDSFSHYKEIPSIMVQMSKIGEETGELGHILQTLAKFYQREVVNAVDTLVDLIEPVMIVMLGLGVAFLLASVLIPIYNISASI